MYKSIITLLLVLNFSFVKSQYENLYINEFGQRGFSKSQLDQDLLTDEKMSKSSFMFNANITMDGLHIFTENNKFGLKDSTGKIIEIAKYDQGANLGFGYAFLSNKYGNRERIIYTKNGKIDLKEFWWGELLSDNYECTKSIFFIKLYKDEADYVGIINNLGQWVVEPFKGNEIYLYAPSTKKVFFYIMNKKMSRILCVYDITTKKITQTNYSYDCNDGRFLKVSERSKNRIAYLDLNGKEVNDQNISFDYKTSVFGNSTINNKVTDITNNKVLLENVEPSDIGNSKINYPKYKLLKSNGNIYALDLSANLINLTEMGFVNKITNSYSQLKYGNATNALYRITEDHHLQTILFTYSGHSIITSNFVVDSLVTSPYGIHQVWKKLDNGKMIGGYINNLGDLILDYKYIHTEAFKSEFTIAVEKEQSDLFSQKINYENQKNSEANKAMEDQKKIDAEKLEFEKNHPKNKFCIALIMKSEKSGMVQNIAYSCYFVNIETRDFMDNDKLISVAKGYIMKNYEWQKNDYKFFKEYVYGPGEDARDFIDKLKSSNNFSDFKVDYITY